MGSAQITACGLSVGCSGIRKELDLFANLRPALCFEALADASTLKREVISGWIF